MNDQEPYTDKETIENYLMTDIDASYDAQLDEWILGMSRYLDRVTNRILFRTAETTHLYDGDGSSLMVIDDVCSISALVISGQVQTDYYKYPAAKPYTSRIAMDCNGFIKGRQNVAVTGVHAMSDELLPDIKIACTKLVAGIVQFQQNKDKAGTTERIGDYSISYTSKDQEKDIKASVQDLINSYKRITV